MQIEWLKKEGHETLLTIFMGWGCDTAMIKDIEFNNVDIVAIFNYEDIELEPLRAIYKEKYKSHKLIAWSFGVWASDLAASRGLLPEFQRAIALNGTPKPIDNEYGIPEKLFMLTLNGLKRVGMTTFYERISSDNEIVKPSRSLTEMYQELQNLYDLSKESDISSIAWSCGVVGGRDLVFPPSAMQRYWEKRDIFVRFIEQMEHYPFTTEGVRIINELLDEK